MPNSPNGPGTTVTGGIDIGIPNFLPRPKYPDERRYQFIDNVTWYTGAHSMKTGFDINYVQENLINLFQGAGIYAYPNINAIASDCPLGRDGMHAARHRDVDRPASLHELQPGVRPSRPGSRGRHFNSRRPITTGSSRTTGASATS